MVGNSASCGEEQDIPDDSTLLRSVRHHADDLRWDSDRREWLPTDRALQFDPDFSTQWENHLVCVHGLAVDSVVTDGRPLVFDAEAGDFRSISLGVRHSPMGDEPIECAHSSVDWPGGREPDKPAKRKLRAGMRRGMRLVHGEISLEAPPGA
jgi:hypothetical protein